MSPSRLARALGGAAAALIAAASVIATGCGREAVLDGGAGAIRTLVALGELSPDDPDQLALASQLTSVEGGLHTRFETPSVTPDGLMMEPWVYPKQPTRRCADPSALPQGELLWTTLRVRDPGREGQRLCYRSSPNAERFALTLSGTIEASGRRVRYCLRGRSEGHAALIDEPRLIAPDVPCEP